MTLIIALLTKITAAQNEVVLSYDRVHGLYFLVVIFAASIISDDVIWRFEKKSGLSEL